MKYRRKITGCLLLFVMCLSFSGCGAFQVQMAKTTTRMAKLDSFHIDAEVYVGSMMNIGEQIIRMDATVTGGLDAETEPFLIRSDLHLETLGVERDLRFFIRKEYDTWDIVPWDEDRLIDGASIQERSAKRNRTTQALKLLIKCRDYFEDPVDDTVNGVHARRFDGVFPDEYVDEALILLNLKEPEPSPDPADEAAAGAAAEAQTETDTEVRTVESTAAPAEAAGQAGEDAGEGEEETVSGLPGSIWINDDDMIVQVDVDLAGFLQRLMDQGLEQLLSEYDLDGLNLSGELQYVDARLTFSMFNEVPALKMPAY